MKIREDLASSNLEQAYADADRLANDMYQVQFETPHGFQRAGDAFQDYAIEASKAYRQMANDLNEPSIRGNVEMATAVGRSSAYAKRAIEAFESDLEHAPFTHSEKQRLIDRLMHG